ncbi:MAG: glycosyltransferase family 9 protein [Fusobacterium sp.]|nr:glycosyltransferase family 9 protein [Fusobacterium sp.]
MKILVIRLSSIGDIILTTPVLKAFKEKYPEAVVDFLVLDKFKSAIEGLPYIDSLILFNKEKNDGIKNMRAFAEELKKNNYDYVFDLHSKLRSKIISRYLGVQCYRYKKRSWWKTLLVKMRLIKYKVDDTIVKNYFGAFKNFGIKYKGEDLTFSFPKESVHKFDEFVDLPVIAPGASKNTKKWTTEGFGILAKLIFEKYEKKTVLIGGKEDIKVCEKIDKISGGHTINLAGKLSLKESGALLSRAKFLVTNDSGPFHIARGVKCKTFVIFGPTSPEMFEFGENDILIYSGENCAPCSLHGDKVCPKHHFNCMKNIKSEMILKEIEKKIKL